MKAIVLNQTGEALHSVDRPTPRAGAGEVTGALALMPGA
jgi:NADPH:quinone reductase-like Zn-dependent oxidoreductase